MRVSKFHSAAAQGAAALALLTTAAAPAFAAPVKNVVLVHGAFVGGAGWRSVYDILKKDGYNVTLVQEPLTSFNDDVTATKRVLDSLDGPCVLVGHSYGGAIISEAGNDDSVYESHPKEVAALIERPNYVGAHTQRYVDFLASAWHEWSATGRTSQALPLESAPAR